MVSVGRLDFLDEPRVLAVNAFAEGRFEEVVDITRRALSNYVGPALRELHELHASALELLGEYERCVMACRHWMNVFGPCLENLRLLLESSYLLEKPALVEQCIVEIVEMYLAAEQLPERKRLDARCSHVGMEGEGHSFTQEDIEAPDLYQYLFLLAFCYLSDLGKRIDFEKIPIRILPPGGDLVKNERLMIVVGYSELTTGDESQGVALMEDVIGRSEDDEFLAVALLCLWYAEKGHLQKALRCFGEALATALHGHSSFDGLQLPLELHDLLDALPSFAEVAMDVHPEILPLVKERQQRYNEDSPEPRKFSSLIFKRRRSRATFTPS